MNEIAFLIGNGLSIALSESFSLRTVTKEFIDSLDGQDKEFLSELAKYNGTEMNFDDFESNFSDLEASLSSLKRYRNFINSKVGGHFLKKYNLEDPRLEEHETVIDKLYMGYVSKILTLIHGNVRVLHIKKKLTPFVKFFIGKIKGSSRTYILTLNYDLLVETILLEFLVRAHFTDFCCPSGKLSGMDIEKFDFNPQRNRDMFESEDIKTELFHLHGSLSLFYDYNRNRALKLKSSDIEGENIYDKIKEGGIPLIPAIIIGGGKSEKIVEYPFDFYYRSAKDLCDAGRPKEFYIIGYSFRDDHVNDLIKRWTENVNSYENGLRIIDYRTDQEEQSAFKKHVRSQIRKRPKIPDECFIFDGVNGIASCPGAEIKPKKVVDKTF